LFRERILSQQKIFIGESSAFDPGQSGLALTPVKGASPELPARLCPEGASKPQAMSPWLAHGLAIFLFECEAK
jgi:hypothetical protein